MPLPDKPLSDQCDLDIASVLNDLITRQPGYLVSKGKYFQGTPITASTPKDGATAPVVKTGKPTDQAETWLDIGAVLPANSTMKIECHVYNGPRGKGWFLVAQIQIGTDIWVKKVNGAGAETEKLNDWQILKLNSKP